MDKKPRERRRDKRRTRQDWLPLSLFLWRIKEMDDHHHQLKRSHKMHTKTNKKCNIWTVNWSVEAINGTKKETEATTERKTCLETFKKLFAHILCDDCPLAALPSDQTFLFSSRGLCTWSFQHGWWVWYWNPCHLCHALHWVDSIHHGLHGIRRHVRHLSWNNANNEEE